MAAGNPKFAKTIKALIKQESVMMHRIHSSDKYQTKVAMKRKKYLEQQVQSTRDDFIANVRLCKGYLKAYEKTQNPQKLEKAREIFTRDILGQPNNYKEIKRPENRIMYLNMLDKSQIFKEDKERLDELEELIKTKNDNDEEILYKPKIKGYADLIALFVNLKEKNYPDKVIDDFRMLSSKLSGSYKIMGERRSSDKQEDFLRDKNGKIIHVAPICSADTTLDEKKARLQSSIDAKRRAMLETKLRNREDKEISRPSSSCKRKTAAKEKKRKEEERVRLSMAMSMRIANNYGNDP